MRVLLVLIAAATLSACATTGGRASLDPRDPMEGFNRGVWEFNTAADKVVVKPVTEVYRTVTPRPARRGLSRVFANLTEPLSFINNLLQGKPKRAFNSLGRFIINTTIGVGGLADHATELGLPPTREDFGQTLAAWGAKKSPYLVLPLLGPSTVRDGIGTVVDFAADPVPIALHEAGETGTERAAITGLRLIDARSQAIDSGVDAVLESSADPYAAARSAYFQQRAAEIADQAEGPAATTPEEQEDLLNKALQDAAPDAQPEARPEQPKTGPDQEQLSPDQPQEQDATNGGD